MHFKKFKAAKIVCVFSTVFSLLGTTALFAGGRNEEARSAAEDCCSVGRGEILASTNIIAQIVYEVAGDLAESELEISAIIEEGTDPHSYEPSPRDLVRFSQAGVIFINGFGYEEALLPYLEIDELEGKVVSVSEGILPIGAEDEHGEHNEDEDDDHDDHSEHDAHDDDDHDEDAHDDDDEHSHDDHDHHGQAEDPHVWFDPSLVNVWAQNIAEILSEIYPDLAEDFFGNAEDLGRELAELDNEIEETIAQLADAGIKFIIDHNNIAYFERAYDFEVLGYLVEGHSHSVGPSAQHLAEIQEIIANEDNVRIVMSNIANREIEEIAQALVEDAGGNAEIVYIQLETLEDGESYIEFMRRIARQLREAA